VLYVDSNPTFGSSEREFLLPRGLIVTVLAIADGIGTHYGVSGSAFSGLKEIALEVTGQKSLPIP
jgi:hypothetical protein